MTDLYKLLGVEKTATQDEIKKAYRKCAMKYHPDANETNNADFLFSMINEAYSILSDPQKRKEYDHGLLHTTGSTDKTDEDDAAYEEPMPKHKVRMPNPLFTVLRVLLKIILLPVRLVIFIFTGAMGFILGSAIVNFVFYIVSGLLFILFLFSIWSVVTVNYDMPMILRILTPGIFLLLAFLTNPFSGVLKFLRWLIERIEDFNDFLKEI